MSKLKWMVAGVIAVSMIGSVARASDEDEMRLKMRRRANAQLIKEAYERDLAPRGREDDPDVVFNTDGLKGRINLVTDNCSRAWLNRFVQEYGPMVQSSGLFDGVDCNGRHRLLGPFRVDVPPK